MLHSKGFTLIELIMVILLLGIVATISVQFVSLSTKGAIDSSNRQKQALKGVVISERVTRELREALPGSVRVSGNCVSFVPIKGAGYYREVATASGPEYEVIPEPAVASWVPVVASPSGDISSLEYPLAMSLQSPRKRFYYVADAHLFFLQSDRLYRQVIDGDYEAGCSDQSATPERILATNITLNDGAPLFVQESGLFEFSFQITSPNSNETMPFIQALQVRNAP